MKNLITLLLFVSLFISCEKEELKSDSRDCREVEYEISFDMKLEDEVCFPDGNSIILSNIEHQICPPYAYCKWAGDLFVTLNTATKASAVDKQFFPVAIKNNPGIFDNHEITSITYTYDSANGEVPPNKEDFDPKKTVLTITINKI